MGEEVSPEWEREGGKKLSKTIKNWNGNPLQVHPPEQTATDFKRNACGMLREMQKGMTSVLNESKKLFQKESEEHLAGSVSGTRNSWFQGSGFKPHMGCRDRWKKKN